DGGVHVGAEALGRLEARDRGLQALLDLLVRVLGRSSAELRGLGRVGAIDVHPRASLVGNARDEGGVLALVEVGSFEAAAGATQPEGRDGGNGEGEGRGRVVS